MFVNYCFVIFVNCLCVVNERCMETGNVPSHQERVTTALFIYVNSKRVGLQGERPYRVLFNGNGNHTEISGSYISSD